MFELNANIAVVVFVAISAASNYRRGWIAAFAYVGAGLVWYLALNALRLSWASFAGFGVGILAGLLGLAIMIGGHRLANRRRDWR